MYFAIGWPKILDTSSFGDKTIRKTCCDRVKILFAILTDDTLAIWYTKPCVPIVSSRRTQISLQKYGPNVLVEWKPDSNALVVATSDGTILIYTLTVLDNTKSIYNQIDPPHQNLKRDSAELFVKETIPSLNLTLSIEYPLYVPITCICCVSVSQMMVATKSAKVLRIRWDGVEERDFSLDLKRIPFSINQQVSYAVPITEENTYITSMDYSPLIGGFSITLNDGRAAYLTASNLKFDPNQVQGIWAQNLDDATCGCINHKYRLIAFGRKNSQAYVYTIDDITGGLELSHTMTLSAKDFPGSPGHVREMKWTPDGCAVAVSWSKGGISLWSTFGSMLMCSLGWDYGLHVDLANNNPFDINCMDWSTEGYQLLMLRQQKIITETVVVNNENNNKDNPVLSSSSGGQNKQSVLEEKSHQLKTTLVQLDFVKSSLAVNPCMSSNSHLFLQGDDKLYINQGDSLQKIYHNFKSFSILDQCNGGGSDDLGGSGGGGGMGGGGGGGGGIGSNGSGVGVCESDVYSAGLKQGNIFSQSYNLCTNKYMKGGFNQHEGLLDSVAGGYGGSGGGGGGGSADTFGGGMASSGDTEDYEISNSLQVSSMLSESKHWIIVQLPIAYMATNWPIRFSAIDDTGMHIAAAGRTGVAIYSMITRKWKLFGNETQEKDFVVTGGLLWWDDFLIIGCYSLVQQNDELRLYPRDCKLDNRFARIIQMGAPVMLINLFKDQLVAFTADGYVTIFAICKHSQQDVDLMKLHIYDIRGLCIHPACIISVTMTTLRNDSATRASQGNILQPETIVLNVSGRILMVNRENNGNSATEQLSSTCLASCVECLWLSNSHKTHLRESLWLYCGGHGMRVWLPVFPREGESGHGSHRHTFMSKRIMLSFTLKVYPLGILFEDAIILGVENDTVLYTSDSASHFSLPFCFLKKTSQVYLHQILRQLIRRNLGYNAWEIARSCTNLPYFPHSLELLLHEVLEEEATSKEPIPDALLPSVLEFIQEFPVYLQTVVQCARKTEIALWPYLFATAGKPKELFQQCLSTKQLETAASYLIILQNLEPSSVSRQYATILLETALEQKKWDLAKDLVRFLRAIDPNDVESPRTSFVMGSKLGITQPQSPVTPNAEDLSLILGMTRGRSFSTTTNPKSSDISTILAASANATGIGKERNSISNISEPAAVLRRKKSVPHTQKEKDSPTAEEFFIEVILQRHARRLLQEKKLEALGYMSAALDFHLVGWLAREKDRAARIEDFVATLKQLHDDLDWPKPNLNLKLGRRSSNKSQQESPSYSLQSFRVDAQFGTAGDSGYTSLPTAANPYYETSSEQSFLSSYPSSATVLDGISNNGGGNGNGNSLISQSIEPLYTYNPDLSNLALQNMTLIKFNDLCRISEEGDAISSHHSKYPISPLAATTVVNNTIGGISMGPSVHSTLVNRNNSPIIQSKSKSTTNITGDHHLHHLLMDTEARLTPLIDTASIASEQVSMWGGDDNMSILNADLNDSLFSNNYNNKQSLTTMIDTVALQNTPPQLSPKLEIKIRYLLQIFNEASCFDLSLLLSILLLDSASVGRITNSAIRSGSLAICRQLRNGLKDITRWSFQECLGYRPFMMVLQQQVNQLDKFVIQQESIPHLIATPGSLIGSGGAGAAMISLGSGNITTASDILSKINQQQLIKMNDTENKFSKNTPQSSSTIQESNSSTTEQVGAVSSGRLTTSSKSTGNNGGGRTKITNNDKSSTHLLPTQKMQTKITMVEGQNTFVTVPHTLNHPQQQQQQSQNITSSDLLLPNQESSSCSIM